ncbi:MerR family transcriptional regulator [Oceanirhabdus sp. W0125-5]|uniref:MerR family transcriptional regulator n=1 Tax=Oceanirhabdus sp. W0125-5 TaxID=2999116 RepID=UPI0022F2C325|nr:MerR family transcriptional regulator [Oceanirhabdus sp. W0125-5]WBW97344.1 MerR family transcriptional regulator [Oceanirhabdus sp. W0125-5]
MYTIGQVSKFFGISRDTLKFYEDKGLINPKKNNTNSYREYDDFDIHEILTINSYREIDFEIKKIQEIKKHKSIDDIECMLEEKEQQIHEEILYKNLLLKRIKVIKDNCKKIKDYLGKFIIAEMKPLVVKGELSDFFAYDEYDIIQKHSNNLKNAVTFTGLVRVINYTKQDCFENKFLVVNRVENYDEDIEGEIISYSKCLYTIVEAGRSNIDKEVESNIRKIARENGYELIGLSYVSLLITTYDEGNERRYLEIYTPIKS